MKKSSIFLLYSPGYDGYLTTSGLEFKPISEFKIGQQIWFSTTQIEAKEQKSSLIRYLTNPDKEYRSKEANINEIKQLKIHEISLTPIKII